MQSSKSVKKKKKHYEVFIISINKKIHSHFWIIVI